MGPCYTAAPVQRDLMADTRTETDTFGPIEVASDRYWGAQAQRSLGNFKIGWERSRCPSCARWDRQARGGGDQCALGGWTLIGAPSSAPPTR
jgi:hypothetical protein